MNNNIYNHYIALTLKSYAGETTNVVNVLPNIKIQKAS